ncbi:MAG: hypothetical protein WKG07_38520 [Hymenobacter sp.]
MGGGPLGRCRRAGRFRRASPATGSWLRATVVNTLPQRTRFVWSLYSFVDSAALFVQPGGRGPARFVAGTSGRAVAAGGFPARASLPALLAGGPRPGRGVPGRGEPHPRGHLPAHRPDHGRRTSWPMRKGVFFYQKLDLAAGPLPGQRPAHPAAVRPSCATASTSGTGPTSGSAPGF